MAGDARDAWHARQDFYTLARGRVASRQMTKQRSPRTAHRWLLVLPFVWQAGLAPLIDDVTLRPFSLPFPMAWQMAGIVLTTIVIAIVHALDRRAVAQADGDGDGEGEGEGEGEG